MTDPNLLRALPGIDRLLAHPDFLKDAGEIPAALRTEAVREVVDGARREILGGKLLKVPPDFSATLARRAASLAAEKMRPSFSAVINATGVVLHTNLGRAPLAEPAIAALTQTASGYSNLELNLDTGKRGERFSHVESLLCRLTGAESAMVVNNNAGAVLLALTALGRGREAIVSRGELVEIGGSFRIPEVMEAGGLRLREVGATNRTRLADYRNAICEETALLLKVHPSNYRIQGFCESVSAAELTALGREAGLPVMEDLGSGLLLDLSPYGLPKEPTVRDTVTAGIDVVTFSGDKLLGGPQAGIIVGSREHLSRIKKHPMARALRIDKLSLAALEATLRLYLDEAVALEKIPTLRRLTASPEELKRRCRALMRRLRKACPELGVELIEAGGQVGGGALPAFDLPGAALRLTHPALSAETLAERLRTRRPAVMGRIQDDRLILDLRTVARGEESALIAALATAIEGKAP